MSDADTGDSSDGVPTSDEEHWKAAILERNKQLRSGRGIGRGGGRGRSSVGRGAVVSHGAGTALTLTAPPLDDAERA